MTCPGIGPNEKAPGGHVRREPPSRPVGEHRVASLVTVNLADLDSPVKSRPLKAYVQFTRAAALKIDKNNINFGL